MKTNRAIRLAAGFALIAQSVAVIITCFSADIKEKKALGVVAVLSSIAGLFGAYMIYKDLVEPKIALNVSDFTLDDEYDDFDAYADLMGEPEAEECIVDDHGEGCDCAV